MPRRDDFHFAVRTALEKDGWTITDDPLTVPTPGLDFHIDLGAVRDIIGAEKDGERIAVEIKSLKGNMDKQLNYQSAILTFLKDYATVKPSDWKNVDNQLVIDKENHHYQLVRVGWHNGQHIYYAVFHFDLVGHQVHIQENRTDLPIVDELEALGIARKDIRLAFQEMPLA